MIPGSGKAGVLVVAVIAVLVVMAIAARDKTANQTPQR
jgi:hypothetical protein